MKAVIKMETNPKVATDSLRNFLLTAPQLHSSQKMSLPVTRLSLRELRASQLKALSFLLKMPTSSRAFMHAFNYDEPVHQFQFCPCPCVKAGYEQHTGGMSRRG